MIHLIGDQNSFKTVMIKFVIPFLFGGRLANAEPMFAKQGSDFNSETFQSEVLFLDDTKVLGTSHAERSRTSHIIKELTVGHGAAFHGKNKDRVNITPWQIIFRAMNMETETLRTLPLNEPGTEDKYITLRLRSLEGGPVDVSSKGWFEKLKKEFTAEIPAFLHFLLYEYKTPDHVVDPSGRYPVISYKNPEIERLLSEASTEESIMDMLDTSGVFSNDIDGEETKFWQGSVTELYRHMSEVGTINTQRRFMKMCPMPSVLLAQIKILEKSHPDRVFYSERGLLEKKKHNGSFFWRIYPPTNLEADDCF